ncbi:peamaclein-like [Salvia hispanica]|uniref:peamaclein-like n=1 Tax=Salvia hispanica TaxID=49212 RepID=UPI00200972B9|nr:peamaclein-like [Salvia hispanica]
MKTPLVACLVMVCILFNNTFVSADSYGDANYCSNNCKARCARAGVADRCLKYCGICCVKCKCVPEGTYGNKHQCPCYRDLLNSKGKPKCP